MVRLLESKVVYVLGSDGYIGWPLVRRLRAEGAHVLRIDNGVKREWAEVLGVEPLATHKRVSHLNINLADDPTQRLYRVFEDCPPDAIVHLAEQPSAALSMRGRNWARITQANNVLGTLNVAFAMAHTKRPVHLIKLGTMGEYGTPRIPIREGWLDVAVDGYTDRIPFPKRPGSFYHASKVHDSTNLEFCCRNWGFRVTDLNQGVVWGLDTPECGFDDDEARTTFWYDEYFGTVLNRFVAQVASGFSPTVYGKGTQRRGFIHLQDSIECITLAIQNPPAEGEFRVANQLSEIKSILDLAALSRLRPAHIENPRKEDYDHLYEVTHEVMPGYGFTPSRLLGEAEFDHMVEAVSEVANLAWHSEAIIRVPETLWEQPK